MSRCRRSAPPHVTQAQADAVFLGERLTPVLDAVADRRVARGALMRQNLWLAVIYNADRGADRDCRLRDAADRRAGDVRLVDPGDAQRVACAPGRCCAGPLPGAAMAAAVPRTVAP